MVLALTGEGGKGQSNCEGRALSKQLRRPCAVSPCAAMVSFLFAALVNLGFAATRVVPVLSTAHHLSRCHASNARGP